MNKLLGITSIVFLMLLTSCSQKVSDRFIDEHKDNNKVTTVSIPGWLVKTSINQIEDFSRGNDLEVYGRLINYLDGIRFMVSSSQKSVPRSDIIQLNKDLALEEGAEQYASIRYPDGTFKVWITEQKEEIKSIVIITAKDDFFGIARINCHLPIELFKSSDFSFNDLK